jgi:hypothetical protein
VTAAADARTWCEALADTLLPPDVSAGRPVRLNCDDEALAAAATTLSIARPDATYAFVACLHGEGLVDRDRGVRPLAVADDGDPPRYLLGLAALVLAASRMATDEQGSMAAYYRRLGELLGLPLQASWPQIRGVPELVERFDDLAAWMRDRHAGRRGLLDVPTRVHPSVVGVPIHHSLLRAGDRLALGAFFERAGRLIDAGWDPVHQLAQWSGRHQLTQPLQTLLGQPGLHAALAGALRAARRSWDGSTIDASGRRVLPAKLALHLPPGPLTLSATVPALGATVNADGPDGRSITLDREMPTAVPLDWLEHAAAGALTVEAADERVRLLLGPTILFEITRLGVQSIAAAATDPVWVLTCDRRLIDACESHRQVRGPLPAGWALLCDVEPELLSADLRTTSDDDERPLTGVRAVGGLPLSDEVWLLDHPPAIAADLPEPAPVTVDGAAHGDIEPGGQVTLEPIAHVRGTHRIDVGEQKLVVELADCGRREGIGSLAFDADPRRIHGGVTARDTIDGTAVCGPQVTPLTPPPSRSLIVRYRCTVDVIDIDGTRRSLGPPAPAAWLEHVGLPQDGPWEIPGADRVAWLCVDVPGRQFIVAHQAVDVPVTDDVMDVVEWYSSATQIVDRTGGGADVRWQRLRRALEAAI